MNQRLTPLVVACALAAGLLLAACGGGGEDSEVEAISSVINESVTSGDPSKCTELMTADFVEQGSNESGAAAIEECEAEAPDRSDDPDELTVSAVQIEGSEASAEVAFVGGGYDGQTLTVSLLRDGDRWKLDEISGFTKFDATALAAALEARFEAVSTQITPAQVACIGDLVREASQAQMGELLLSGDSTKFVEFAQACE